MLSATELVVGTDTFSSGCPVVCAGVSTFSTAVAPEAEAAFSDTVAGAGELLFSAPAEVPSDTGTSVVETEVLGVDTSEAKPAAAVVSVEAGAVTFSVDTAFTLLFSSA